MRAERSVHRTGAGLSGTRLPRAARTGSCPSDELAAYLGVPKKTVYGCWRQWGLRGYRVGRYLRFRERQVEEWLQSREV